LPGSLSAWIRPFINLTICRQIARPRPVPPYFRVVEPSACVKDSNRLARISGSIPMPVSFTENFTSTWWASFFNSSALMRISPRSVNLNELLTRLIRTWPNRKGSPFKYSGMSIDRVKIISIPFSMTFPENILARLDITASILNSTFSRLSFPASILEKSRISLIIFNREFDDSFIFLK